MKTKKKVRIISKTFNGRTVFTIQQKHHLFRWMWCDAWQNSSSGASCKDSYPTLQEAKAHLSYFDGSRVMEKVVYEAKDDEQ